MMPLAWSITGGHQSGFRVSAGSLLATVADRVREPLLSVALALMATFTICLLGGQSMVGAALGARLGAWVSWITTVIFWVTGALIPSQTSRVRVWLPRGSPLTR